MFVLTKSAMLAKVSRMQNSKLSFEAVVDFKKVDLKQSRGILSISELI